VAALGQRHLVRGHWLKPGAIVLDAGINLESIVNCEAPENMKKYSNHYRVYGGVHPNRCIFSESAEGSVKILFTQM